MQNERFSIIECILFVSGEPVALSQLQRTLDLTSIEMNATIEAMERQYREEGRGIQLFLTPDTVQMVSNKGYAPYVEQLLQPSQTKSFSQAMLETLSVIAYKQPVTRSDIEAARGVRCDYSVRELLKLGLIREVGRRDTVGRPTLFGTTDAFLRQFGIHSIDELPEYGALSHAEMGGTDLPLQPEATEQDS